MPDMIKLRVLVGTQTKAPFFVQALAPKGTTVSGLLQRIKTAVTNWANQGTEDAQRAMSDAIDSFTLLDLSGCIYNSSQAGLHDDVNLIRELDDQGVHDLIIDRPYNGSDNDWTLDTPLVEIDE